MRIRRFRFIFSIVTFTQSHGLKAFRSSFWLNSFFFTFLQRFSLVFLGAASFIILVHSVSPAEFSNWALYTVILSSIEMVKSGLLRNAVIKFLATAEPSDRPKVIASAFWINAVYSLIIILLVIFLHTKAGEWLKAPSLPGLLTGAIPLLASLLFFSHYEMMLQSQFRFDLLFMANFIRPILFFLGLLLLYFFSKENLTLTNALYLQVSGVVIATVYITIRGNRIIPLRTGFYRKQLRSMLQFGKFTAGTNFISQLSRSFDHLLTAYLLPPTVGSLYVSYYNVVTRINNMTDVPSLAVADVVYPKQVQVLEDEGLSKVRHYFEQVTGAVIAIMLPISLLLFFFPVPVLTLIGGGHYEPAALILRISVLVGMVRPVSYQFGALLDSIGRPDRNFYLNLLLLGSSFILYYVFIKTWGGMGAAYAMPLQYGLTLLLMFSVLKRTTGLNTANIWKAFLGTYRRLDIRRKKRQIKTGI